MEYHECVDNDLEVLCVELEQISQLKLESRMLNFQSCSRLGHLGRYLPYLIVAQFLPTQL